MTQSSPYISGGANVTKMHLKDGNFPENPIGIFHQYW